MKYIIHHGDADGRCAAALAAEGAKAPDVKYYELQYGEEPPWNEFMLFEEERDEMWLVDFSFSEPLMQKLRGYCGEFYWIDHHYTALRDLIYFDIGGDDGYKGLPGLRRLGTGACKLTWQFLQSHSGCLGAAPKFVEYISDYDVGRNQWPESKYLVTYLADMAFEVEEYQIMLDTSDLDFMLKEGRKMYRTNLSRYRRILAQYGYKTTRFDVFAKRPLKSISVNYPGNGHVGRAGKEMGYQIVHCYNDFMRGGALIRKHHVYTDDPDINLGVFAAMHGGGGGHRGAAGWEEIL